MNLIPGMGTEAFSNESDLTSLINGPLWNSQFVPYARVSGAARDTGNTGSTTVLRVGLVMSIISATNLWTPWVTGAVDGSQFAAGILCELGLNTQMDAADADRWLATILVKGIVNPEAMCVASTANYGLIRTGTGLTIRKHLMYQIIMSDDYGNDLTIPRSGR